MPDSKELWKEFQGKKTVLYGLGTETGKAIAQLEGYLEIVGLLDGFQESGEMYGKNILTCAEAAALSVKLIVVVARPGSCRAIAKRMEGFCREHKVALYDIRGKDLLVRKQVVYEFKKRLGGTEQELLKKAEDADVVSFDLFDTLVMRQVLSYTDIFAIMDFRLKEQGIFIDKFENRRMNSEKELAKYGAPTLAGIYENLLGKLPAQMGITAGALAELEWQIDYSVLIPRLSVKEAYEELLNRNKKIYIISDTYYRKFQIEKILDKCGISGYEGIYCSCEYHTGKTQELFVRFKEEVRGRSYLHIGDDLTADVEFPSKEGMDVFRIYSGADLLEELGYLGMEGCINHLADRIKGGLLVSRLLNNPFQFEIEAQAVSVKESFDIGYLICAPMICDFILWFSRRVKETDIKNVWFPARDGYLLQKLFRILGEEEGTYFLTSRTAAIRAGIESLSDIAYVDTMKFFGTVEENLSVRFGLDSKEAKAVDETRNGLMKYSDAILENAKEQRNHYEAYISQVRIQEGEIAFFDFVAKGTTQLYMQRMLAYPLKGLYFLQIEPDFPGDERLDVEAFYSREEMNTSAIFDNYYILEAILTAPHPQIMEFKENGEPVYAEETRNSQDIGCIMEVQEGILEYCRNYFSILPCNLRIENKKLDEIILRLFHGLRIKDEKFRALNVEDPFFNRRMQITDLIEGKSN